jgi:hypothetical protein
VQVFCGIDWAEDHYDVALVDQAGVVLTHRRIDDNFTGYQLLLTLLAEHGDDQVERPGTIEQLASRTSSNPRVLGRSLMGQSDSMAHTSSSRGASRWSLSGTCVAALPQRCALVTHSFS